MEELEKKAQNYFIIARMAEKIGMLAEAASNYFKALSAINDFALKKINFAAKDHSERFSLLKANIPKLYEITDKLFITYRRTYTEELEKQELARLRKNIEEAFKHANVNIPTDKEIEEQAKKLIKK